MKRGILFALVFACIFCLPAFAEVAEPDTDPDTVMVDSGDPGSGDPASAPDESGTDTVILDQVEPLEVMAIDDVAPAAITGNGYTGMMSDQYVNYFSAVVSKYWGRDYVAYRSGQYSYTLVYDADLEVNGSRFTGTGKSVVIKTGSYNTGDWSIDWLGEESVNLSLSDVALYSNLSDFPQIEGGERLEKSAAVILCLAALTVFTCGILFGRVRG